MPAGLQTFDSNSNLLFDGSDRLGKVVDIFDSGVVNGSKVCPGLARGNGFIFVEENSADLPHLTFYSMPNVSFTGTTVTWSFVDIRDPYSGGMAARRSVRISVGVY